MAPITASTRAAVPLAAGALLLLGPAVVAEQARPGGDAGLQALLVALLALAFGVSGLAWIRTTFPAAVGLLLLAVAVAWLLPSLVPGTMLWHQGVLLLALTFPLVGWRRAAIAVCAAILVAGGVGDQLGAAIAFAIVAVSRTIPQTSLHAGRRLQAVAAGVVAVALAVLWAWEATGSYEPDLGLLGYELCLVTASLVMGLGATTARARAQSVEERLLTDPPDDGVEGLLAILREELADPSLRLLEPGSPGLPLVDRGETVAVLAGRDRTLSDPAVAAAVSEAVRVVREWVARREALERRNSELAVARLRVAQAVEAERAAVGAELADEVLSRIDRALADLDLLIAGGGTGEAVGVLDEACAQLRNAGELVRETVTGATGVLDKGLVVTLLVLAARSTVPCAFASDVPVGVDPAAVVGEDAARALYFVCSEALANVHKHASATHINVTLTISEASLTLRVTDDGGGGADPAGAGLRGLIGRVAALGGTITVSEVSGTGTEVAATLPVLLPQPVAAIRTQGRSTR